jgi:hypothetical protein
MIIISKNNHRYFLEYAKKKYSFTTAKAKGANPKEKTVFKKSKKS